MEEMDMRNMLLSELIDKMHGRLADKMYPPSSMVPMPDPAKDDQPAATEIPGTEAQADEKMIDKDDDMMTDEELDAMMKDNA